MQFGPKHAQLSPRILQDLMSGMTEANEDLGRMDLTDSSIHHKSLNEGPNVWTYFDHLCEFIVFAVG